jgi:hypothetical protein
MALFSDSPGSPTTQSAGAFAREAVREASPWITWLARLGYAAIGIVYIVLGALAADAALSGTGPVENTRGAVYTIYDRPFGRPALVVIAVGLAGYVLWRVVSAIFDAERKGGGVKGIGVRIGYLGSAAVYASLALECTRLVMGSRRQGSGQGDQQADHWTAVAMAQPLGRAIVAAVGGGVIVFGLYQLYRAFAGELRKRLDLSGVSPRTADNIVRFGRAGHAARGVVFGIIGLFFVQAALHFDPEEAKDLAGALQVVRSQPHGPWLLGAVSVGMIAWGLWRLANARYRRIRPA